MTADVLTTAIAAELLQVPEVERLYPPRRSLRDAVRAAATLVQKVGGSPDLESDGAVSVDVGIRSGADATAAGLACIAAVRRVLPADRADSPVRVRIVAVG